jgi:hypothetical protein
VGVASYDLSPTSYTTLRGVQSVGINTSFNPEQFFELGQLAVYQNVDGVPDISVTLEKCLDGYPLIWHSCTQGATAGTLVGRSNQRANIAIGVFADTNATASGNQLSQVICSGMYVSQLGYDFQVQGASRESVTLVGNDKVWATGSFSFTGFTAGMGVSSPSPAAPEGVNRRQNMIMSGCLWPKSIYGISSSGTNDDTGSGSFTVGIQSVRISSSFGRNDMLELGRFGPYFRYVDFPVETTTAIEIMAKDGDHVAATQAGVYANYQNTQDEHIYVATQEGTKVDMGTQNRLTSVNMSGGNAGRGGGNATITYSYQGWNTLTVSHPADPTVALRA